MIFTVQKAFGAFFFLYFAYLGLMSPYASLYFSQLGFNAIQIATLMSMLQITRILGPFSWGWLSDYLSERIQLIRFCAVLASLLFFAFFFLKGYWPLLIWMFVIHTILSSQIPLGEAATVHALFKDNSFDQGYGRLRLWGSLGFISMVLISGELFENKGIELFPWLGAIVLLVFAANTFFLHEPKMERRKMLRGELRSVLKNPQVRWFLFSSFSMVFGHAALYVFYSLYLLSLGYGKLEIGLFWTLGVAAEVLFFYYQNWFLSRYSPKLVLIICCWLGALRFILIGYLPSAGLLVLAQLFHAASFAAHHSASTKLIRHWFSGPVQGRGQALFTTISYGFGGSLGGLCAGWIWEHWGPSQVFGMAALACLVAAFAIQHISNQVAKTYIPE